MPARPVRAQTPPLPVAPRIHSADEAHAGLLTESFWGRGQDVRAVGSPPPHPPPRTCTLNESRKVWAVPRLLAAGPGA